MVSGSRPPLTVSILVMQDCVRGENEESTKNSLKKINERRDLFEKRLGQNTKNGLFEKRFYLFLNLKHFLFETPGGVYSFHLFFYFILACFII